MLPAPGLHSTGCVEKLRVGQNAVYCVCRFGFVLVRVTERRGPVKLVVRGAHGSTPTSLQQALQRQVSHQRQQCSAASLC